MAELTEGTSHFAAGEDHIPQHKDELSANSRVNFRAVATCTVACIGALAMGMCQSYPSTAFPDLNANPNPYHMTDVDQSWFTSLFFVGALPGNLVGTVLSDKWGRRTTLMLATLPWVAAWVAIIASQNPATAFVARLVLGFAAQPYMVVTSVYVAEIAPASMRGRFASLFRVAFTSGTLLSNTLGVILHWNYLALACMMPSIVLLVFMTFLPESPRWLRARGRMDDAAVAAEWLGCDIELKTNSVQMDRRPTPWLNYLRPPLLLRFGASQGMFASVALAGVTLLNSYLVTIFQNTGSAADPFVCSVLVAAAGLCGSIVSSVIAGFVSQRHLQAFSSLMMSVGYSVAAVFMLLPKEGEALQWLPLAGFILVGFGCFLGGQAGALFITNELFATNARGRACCLGKLTFDLLSFVVNKSFTHLRAELGLQSVFWILAALGAIGFVFVLLCVPESNGKNLDELEREFDE